MSGPSEEQLLAEHLLAAPHGRPRVADTRRDPRPPGWDRASDLAKDPAEIPDPSTTEVPAELRAEIEAHMSHYPDRRSAALPALAAAQRVHGWCSPDAIEQVACVMRVTPAYLESVASFYDMLETEPVGRHYVYVCTNISCSLRGADELYAAAEQAALGDPDVNVRSFECLGACDIAPMASADGVYVGPLEPGELPQLFDDLRAGRNPLPEKQLARRLVADPKANSREYPEHEPQHHRHLPLAPEIPPERAAFGPGMDEDRPGATAAIEPQPEHHEEDSS